MWCGYHGCDQIILGRPWLFDKDVTIYGRSNMCQFEHKDKKTKLLPLRSKIRSLSTPIAPKKTKEINLISVKVLDQKLKKEARTFPSLALLPTPHAFPLITTTLFFSSTGLICYSRQSFLFYYRHHPIIEYLSLRLYLHWHHMCTHYTKRSVMELNIATLTKNCKLTLERNLKPFNVGNYVMVRISPKQFFKELLKSCIP